MPLEAVLELPTEGKGSSFVLEGGTEGYGEAGADRSEEASFSF